MKKEDVQLIVEINGGVLTDIKANTACDILVLDWDNIAHGDKAQLWTTTPQKEIDAVAAYVEDQGGELPEEKKGE